MRDLSSLSSLRCILFNKITELAREDVRVILPESSLKLPNGIVATTWRAPPPNPRQGSQPPGPPQRGPPSRLKSVKTTSTRWAALTRRPNARPPLLRGTGDGRRVGSTPRAFKGGQIRPKDGLRAILSVRSHFGWGSQRSEGLKGLRSRLRPCEHMCPHNALVQYTRVRHSQLRGIACPDFPRAPGFVAHPYAVARPSPEGWTGVRYAGLGNPPGARALTETQAQPEASACVVQGSQPLAGVWGRSPPGGR